MKNILEAVSDYNITLSNGWAFCPFHVDTGRANFKVYEETNSWFCFRCNEGGDVVSFIARMERISRSAVLQKYETPESEAEESIQMLDSILAKTFEPDLDLNHECNLLLSRMSRELLIKYPEQHIQIFKFLRKLDLELFKPIKYPDMHKLIEELQNLPKNFV